MSANEITDLRKKDNVDVRIDIKDGEGADVDFYVSKIRIKALRARF